MKKIPFYNPASPLFFHIAVLLLYILIFLLLLLLLPPLFFITIVIFIFSVVYPLFALAMTILVRKAYINTYQAPVPEQLVNKLVIHNRYLITVIYVFSFIAGFFEANKTDAFAFLLFLLFISGLCFLFYLFGLPSVIGLILLKKMIFILEVITLGIFFLLFLLGLFMINILCRNCIILFLLNY